MLKIEWPMFKRGGGGGGIELLKTFLKLRSLNEFSYQTMIAV